MTFLQITDQFDLLGFFPIMTLLVIMFLFMLMVFCYLKIRVFIVILVIYLFSLVIGLSSMSESIIPFTPYLQIFFLLFQTVIFTITSLEVFRNEN